jgi:hypothetical protein
LGHWTKFTYTSSGYSHFFHLHSGTTDPVTFLFENNKLVEEQKNGTYLKDTLKILYTYDQLQRLTEMKSYYPSNIQMDTIVRIKLVYKSKKMAELYSGNSTIPALYIYIEEDFYLLYYPMAKEVRKYYLNGTDYRGEFNLVKGKDVKKFNQWKLKRENKYDENGNWVEYTYNGNEYISRNKIIYK